MSGRITLWLVLGAVILGCGVPSLVTSPPPQPVAPEAVETIIVQTAAAAQTQTIEVLPPTNTPTLTPLATGTATVTPTPTATFLFLFPTNTSLPDAFLEDEIGDNTSSTSSDSSNSNSNVDDDRIRTRDLWNCRILSKSPANGAVIVGGTRLRTVWVAQNTGSETWPKKSVDILYVGGLKLVKGKSIFDIPRAVAPGDAITISITMDIPKLKGDYQTRWGFKIGRTTFCTVRFSFEVQ